MPVSSSSSLDYCDGPACIGAACTHFSSWNLYGVHSGSTDNGILYLRFNNFGSLQQVEIYKDVSYFYLVALGQGTIGSISITQRNASGITGSVTWDGVPVSFSTIARLNCLDMSTSSSSSKDSSSTSSESSESTGCCQPTCYGSLCTSVFTSWNLVGMSKKNTEKCALYVGFEVSNGYQQVRIYKDSLLVSLVAIGQRLVSSGAGTISFAQVSSSGLSGSVYWDGTQAPYGNTVTLDCDESSSSSIDSSSSSSVFSTTSSSSSSSNSSSSSVDSSSSSSSSSESSWGYSSSSSSSSTSNSSSSSIDSSSSSSSSHSSSSSESIGNTSSSSSSPLEIWNQSKPLIMANSAISTVTVENRLSQAFMLYDTTYDIGKVYCYLYSSHATHSFDINLSLCQCDDSGAPTTVISTKTISGSSVIQNGWYSFDFNVSDTTPTNRLLSFVMWQDGGTEDNYVLWGYSIDPSATYAWLSNDNTIWENQIGVIRALKIVGVFDVFDLVNFEVNSPPSQIREYVTAMNSNSASYLHTIYYPAPERIELDQPNIIVSFVVDSSGSMGWNDRFSNRTEFISSLVNRFTDFYPSNVVFDIVKFGAIIANPQSITARMGQTMAINLDLRTPDRTVYIFTVNPAIFRVYKSAVYTHNGYIYTPVEFYETTTTIALVGSGPPLLTGTLTRTGGEGDDTIAFTSNDVISVDTRSFVALGFKNLTSGHTYNFAGINVDDLALSGVELDLWQLLHPSSETPSISLGLNGPKTTNSLDIVATENLVARSPFGSAYTVANVTSSVSKGSTLVSVSNVLPFTNGSRIDLVDINYLSEELVVVSNDGSTITFTPGATFDIGDNNEGGIIQLSSFLQKIQFTGTTIQLYLRDVDFEESEGAIVFFLQSYDGYLMEWDIEPHTQWYNYNIYWMGETALLPISVFDTEGTPFPNGTRIDLEVNGRSNIISTANVKGQLLTEIVQLPTNTIFVYSLEGFVREQSVTLVDKGNYLQLLTIEELGQDNSGKFYIRFYQQLRFPFDPDNGAILLINGQEEGNVGNSPIPISLSLVDATTIYAGKTLSESLRKPYDPPSVPPLTTYAYLNNTAAYIKEGVITLPTIDGNGVVRILPITEDVLKTLSEKENEAERLLRMEPTSDMVGQEEETTGDLENLSIDLQEVGNSSGLDYTIDSPIFLYNGEAESAMTTIATELILTEFPGLTIPGIKHKILEDPSLWIKEYEIFPSISILSKTNAIVAKQYFDSFIVDFTPPYNIVSERDDETKQVRFWIPLRDEECGFLQGYHQEYKDGVWASDENGSYTINYIVTEKFRLIPSAKIKIHIYSNRAKNMENAVMNGFATSEYFLNIKYPDVVNISNGVSTVTTHLSEIDQWRQDVANNQVGSILEEMNTETIPQVLISGTNINQSDPNLYLDNIDLFYDSSTTKQWTDATQYEIYETTIDVINGRASYTLPPSDTPAIIFIEAALSFGGGKFEAIRGDIVLVANPIVVGPLTPTIMIPDGISVQELQAKIEWMDGDITIDDGIWTDVIPTTTTLSPAGSETNGGVINGLFLGPHAPYVYYAKSDESCPPVILEESVTVEIDHTQSGYTNKVLRIIGYTGASEEVTEKFYFKVNNLGFGWADGTNVTSAIVSNLFDEYNPTDEYVGEDGIDRLMGMGQKNNLASYVKGNVNVDNRFIIDSTALTPTKMRWNENGIVSFTVPPLNLNVGVLGESIKIVLNTSYIGETRARIGYGVETYSVDEENLIYPTATFAEPLEINISLEAYEYTFIRNGIHTPNVIAEVTWRGKPITNLFTMPSTGEKITYPMPSVTFLAGVCAQLNQIPTSESVVPIDVRGPTSACLEVISHPDISLTSYVVNTELSRTSIYTNVNSHTHSCIVNDIGEEGNGSTTETIVLVGNVVSHTHSIYWSNVAGEYITDINGDISDLHLHTLRSVAITQLNPTTNTGLSIITNGYVVYDPTMAKPSGNRSRYFPTLPFGNRLMFNTGYFNGYTPSQPSQPTLELEFITGSDLHLCPDENSAIIASIGDSNPFGPQYFTAEDPFITERGFDIKAQAAFGAYTYEDYPGHSITIPSRLVSDGSRLTFEVTPYKVSMSQQVSLVSNNPNVNVVAPDLIKKYMALKFKATIAAEGLEASKEFYIMINSNLQWLSGIQALMPELSNDASYVTTALTKIDYIGGSQLHDAVKEATQRIIQEQTDNPTYKDYEKVIVLLTDGDENSSEYSLQQGIDGINFIDGKKQTPAIGMQLGKVGTSDEIIMRKYAEKTNGIVYPMINLVTADINNLIDYITETSTYGFNYGTFKNMFTFEQPSIPIEFRLGWVYLPDGTNINYRIRSSTDGEAWSSWSPWKNYNVVTRYDDSSEKILQYQYEVQFFGNGNFESPVLYGSSNLFGNGTITGGGESGSEGISNEDIITTSVDTVVDNTLTYAIADGDTTTLGSGSGPTAQYNKPQAFTIFFKPISINTTDEEYLSSIHITHEADIPPTSQIVYGLVQSGDLNIEEYMVEGENILADKYTILLTRYNELLTSDNFKTYYSINGRWPKSCSVEIYKFNAQNPDGILVDTAEYATNSITGEINFFNYQNTSNTYTINVLFKPFFRLIARITNFTQETAVLHHVGAIYNTTKRVPTDSDGNIIHKPISKRLNS